MLTVSRETVLGVPLAPCNAPAISLLCSADTAPDLCSSSFLLHPVLQQGEASEGAGPSVYLVH